MLELPLVFCRDMFDGWGCRYWVDVNTLSSDRELVKKGQMVACGLRDITVWLNICAYWVLAVISKIRFTNLLQQTLSSILQKRSTNHLLSSIPFFVPTSTPPYAQHGVYSTIRAIPQYHKHGDVVKLRLHLWQLSSLQRLGACVKGRL